VYFFLIFEFHILYVIIWAKYTLGQIWVQRDGWVQHFPFYVIPTW